MSSIEYKLEQMAYANTSRQMNWQERMSNTSHQREVADLQAAGLNPALSANAGAQAYTTSVDSAVNALGNLAATREAAAAQRYAARQSAAATKYAADQSIHAQKLYGFQQMQKGRQDYFVQKKLQDNQKANTIEIQNSIPVNSIPGLIDKHLRNVGITDMIYTSNALKSIKDVGSKLLNSKIFWTPLVGKKITKKNFKLSKEGVKEVNKSLEKLGLAKTAYNRNLVVKAYTFGDQFAMRALGMMVDKSHTSARKVR